MELPTRAFQLVIVENQLWPASIASRVRTIAVLVYVTYIAHHHQCRNHLRGSNYTIAC